MIFQTDDTPIVIVGAGIAGLTAALALAADDHNVIILERTGELAEVGAGLQLSPNACRVLQSVGVFDLVASRAVAPESVRIRSGSSGADLARLPLGDKVMKRHGAPYFVIHRADLQKSLISRVLETSNIDLWLSSEVQDVRKDLSNGLCCIFKKAGDSGELNAKAVIGADGVWSQTRRFIPGHKTAQFTGKTAYRTTIPAGKVDWELMLDTGLWLGPNAHLVHYPIRDGAQFNLVALVDERWTEETWSAPTDGVGMRRNFTKWAAKPRELLKIPQNWTKWALCGVDASGPWADDRIALIGDAAHAMLPFVAQGAAMGIEDAAVLTACLKPGASETIPEALNSYESQRRERVKSVQDMAATNARIYHLSGPMAVARNAALKLTPSDKLLSHVDWIYGWKPPGQPGS